MLFFFNSLEPITFDDIVYIANKLRHELIQTDTLNKIATKLAFKDGLEDECFNKDDSWRIPFIMILIWEKRMKQNSSKKDHSEGAPKRVLARLIIEIADSIKDVKQKEILQTLARKLDMHG